MIALCARFSRSLRKTAGGDRKGRRREQLHSLGFSERANRAVLISRGDGSAATRRTASAQVERRRSQLEVRLHTTRTPSALRTEREDVGDPVPSS